MRRWGMTRLVAAVGAAAFVLGGCDLASDAPIVAPVGPTADATHQPGDDATPTIVGYAAAAAEIEAKLAQTSGQPIDTVQGSVEGVDGEIVADIVEIRATDLSIVLRIQLRPAGEESLDLTGVDGGLSGELGEGKRTIADIALVDEAGERQVLPTVYRPEAATEDPDQRCMCSTLPAVLPPEGVRVTAHYVRPEDGFRSVKVRIPGLGDSRPLAPAGP
ncbi:hypothetical protein [Ornithinimicrobium sp. Y1694]|uniref:hypothetical protein n=1 Tax=Ornithinimicrobium sp. Y1694 TaxID=3418590 RepID=UPI003CF6AF02